jgi:hypothetical protein
LERVVALLALTAALSAVIVTLDALRFHAAALVLPLSGLRFGDLHMEGLAMLGVGAICLSVVVIGVFSAVQQAVQQRAFVGRLERVDERLIDGRPVTVVAGRECAAFCAGFLRPRIFISEGTVACLSDAELRAIVAHEGHHADRRDPLRLLVGRAMTSSLRLIPAVGSLGGRQAVLAELAADAAAVRSLGGPGPLAGALLAFDDAGVGGVAPERVDQLLGDARSDPASPVLLALAGVALAAVSTVALVLVIVPEHPEFPVSSLPACIAALALIASPAWLVTRRVTRALHTSG